MALEVFSSLLEDLGKIMELPLKPDSQNSCLIRFRDNLEVQLERSSDGRYLVIGSTIGQVPTGTYRLDLFEGALKTNYLENPRIGAFAFTHKNDRLVLYHLMPLEVIQGIDIAEILPPFVDKAAKWRKALQANEVPPIEGATQERSSGLFGLTP